MHGERHRLKHGLGVVLEYLPRVISEAPGFAMPLRLTEARSGARVCQGNLAETEVRGRIVCLPEAMHELYHTDLPANHEHLYGFKTADGTFYTLLRTKLAEALFVDEQVRKRELILRGHVLPKTQIFEMTSMNSARNGVICDLYYYCDICAIKTLSPGPCMCCQGPVNLVEKPLR